MRLLPLVELVYARIPLNGALCGTTVSLSCRRVRPSSRTALRFVFFFVFVTGSSSLDDRREDFFMFFTSNSATTALEDARLPCS